MINNSIWGIDTTLFGANTPFKSGPGSDGNKRVIRIPPKQDLADDQWLKVDYGGDRGRGRLDLSRGSIPAGLC